MSVCEVHQLIQGPGTGPTLVLVNSLGSDLGSWEKQMPALRERFRVVRYDTRGHGASPVPPGPYSLAELGGDLLALLDRLGVARACLCGVSLGGATAMWCAAHAPERVDRLLVCFSSALFGAPEDWRARARLVRAEGTGVIAEAVVSRWFTSATSQAQPRMIERMRAMVAATPAEGYASCCEAIAGLDLRADLKMIDAPTLVLSGSEDPATPPEHGRRIAAGIRGARFAEIAASAHLGNFERPDRFNELILEHLEQATGANAGATQSDAKETGV